MSITMKILVSNPMLFLSITAAMSKLAARTCCQLIPSVPSGLLAIPIRYCDSMRVIESAIGKGPIEQPV